MNLPIVNAYGRITRKGVTITQTRTKDRMGRFTLSVPVERRAPGGTGGERAEGAAAPPKGSESRRPWWVNCLVFDPKLHRIVEALSAGDNIAVVGRLDRRRWYGNDGSEHDEWSIIVDSLAAMIPGQRFPSGILETGEEGAPEEPPTPAHVPDEELYDSPAVRQEAAPA